MTTEEDDGKMSSAVSKIHVICPSDGAKTAKQSLSLGGKDKYMAWLFLYLEERMSQNGFHTSKKVPLPTTREPVTHVPLKCVYS